MNMALMIEPNHRAKSEKNILNFKLISHDKNYSKFNMHPHPSLNCGSKICEVASKKSHLSKAF
jgi:hypothetical protein